MLPRGVADWPAKDFFLRRVAGYKLVGDPTEDLFALADNAIIRPEQVHKLVRQEGKSRPADNDSSA